MSQRHTNQQPVQNTLDENQQRFEQLRLLAQQGDETAIADLWHEFAFDFEQQPS